MKMKKTWVTFEKRIEVELVVPESMDNDAIESLVEEVASAGLYGWDDPAWEGYVGRVETIDIPDKELVLGPANKFGYRECSSKLIKGCLVVNDEGNDIVDPADATWYATNGEKE